MRPRPAAGETADDRARGGVALLVVLWVIVALGTASTLGWRAARDGSATATYRVAALRARWIAEGCLAEARAALDRDLAAGRIDRWHVPTQLAAACALAPTAPPGGPIDVNSAPPARLLELPGFDSTVVEAIMADRAFGERYASLDDLLHRLPRDLRDQVMARYGDLVTRVVVEPAGWMMAATVRVDGRSIEVMGERWVRSGRRVAVVARVFY
ncbi:MAG TPA: hypothetical protein VF978_08605 [Gemmatimonadales bacterium]